MNREINFRVWCKPYMDYDIWVNYNKAYGEPDKKHNTPHTEIEGYPNESTIMQFVGVKDKNKKDIYEGDIVLFPNNTKIHIVKYINTGFVLTASNGNVMVYNFNPDILEVIGNIFENTELL